ncbi:MAG: helix-hairpin-helix domain-containing protein [Thermoflexales bacterium]
MNNLEIFVIAAAGVLVGWACTFVPVVSHLRAERQKRADAERSQQQAHQGELERLRSEVAIQQSHARTLLARVATLEAQLQAQTPPTALLTEDRLALLAVAEARQAALAQQIERLRAELSHAQRQLAGSRPSLDGERRDIGGDVALIADLADDNAGLSQQEAELRAALQAQLVACQAKLAQARQEHAWLSAHLQEQIVHLEERRRTSEAHAQDVERQATELRERLVAAQAALAERQRALDALQAEHEALQQRMAERERKEAKPTARQPRFTEDNLPPAKAEAIQAALRLGAKAGLSSCPQPLERIRAIGATLGRRLYEAGVGTYWEVAMLSEEALAEILHLSGAQLQRYNLAAIREDARRLAEETQSVGRVWDGTPPDDLTALEGVGESYQRRLYEAGICTFEALASASPELLQTICPPNRLARPDYAHWIAQARARAGAA